MENCGCCRKRLFDKELTRHEVLRTANGGGGIHARTEGFHQGNLADRTFRRARVSLSRLSSTAPFDKGAFSLCSLQQSEPEQTSLFPTTPFRVYICQLKTLNSKLQSQNKKPNEATLVRHNSFGIIIYFAKLTALLSRIILTLI